MNLKEKELKKSIGLFRYEHSLRVLETAVKLNRIFNVDIEKIETAALFHDCGKIGTPKIILNEIIDKKIMISEEDKKSPEVLHSILGRHLAEHKYGIQDKDVLNAIRYHTTGRPNMSILEKIIFLSDYIEPGREFEGVTKARELAEKNINESIIYAMKSTVNFLKEKKMYIHKDTLDGLNYLLKTKE